MQYGLVALVVWAAACGSSRSPAHGDAGPGFDAAVADTVPTDTADDAPGDAACPSRRAPSVVSGVTPPLTSFMNVVGNGSSSLAVWDVGAHAVWALSDGSGGVTYGDVPPSGLGPTYALGNRYVLDDYSTLHGLDHGTWSDIPLPNDAFAVSGTTAVALAGSGASIFDGTSVGAPTSIGDYYKLAVAGDGSGGFAVLTADSGNGATDVHLGLVRYDGASWHADTVIATVNDGSSYFLDSTVVPFAGSWAALVNVDDVAHVFVPSGTAWTHVQFASTGSVNYALAANGGMLALVGNGGFTAVYKNGTWSQHALTSAVASSGYPPQVLPYGSGFVAVYGDSLDVRAAVFNGTSWGSEIELTTRSGAGDVTTVVASDAFAVGFVDNSTTALVRKVQIFRRALDPGNPDRRRRTARRS